MHTFAVDRDEAKQEVTRLFQIYGAIDQFLESRPRTEEPHPVELLLPVYTQGDANWYTRYLAVTGADPGFGVNAYDPLALVQAALEFLARRRPRCRMRARRLYAVGAVARTFPEIPDYLLAAAALGRRELELLDESTAHAERLAQLLRSTPIEATSAAARDAWWSQLLGSGLIPDPDGVGPRPCSADVSLMDVNGDIDPVPTFKTVLDAHISFEDALRFFDPLKWVCFPAWCSMQKVGTGQNGVQKYRETVSFDCNNDRVLALTVDLDFQERPVEAGPPRLAITEYMLSDSQPQNYVLVNEGRLEISELVPDYPLVRITTTKSLKFSPELDSIGLAGFMCLVGYAGLVEDLICCASQREEGDDYPGIRFAGQLPPEAPHTAQRAASGYGQTPQYGSLLGVMVDETAAAVERCIDEYAQAATASYAKLERGYTADELARDMADWSVRMVREAARLADAGLRIAEEAGRPADRPAARATKEGEAAERQPGRAATPRPIEL